LTVVPQNLVNYIVGRLQEGHDMDTIKHYLLQYGYTPNKIDTAVHFIYKRKSLSSSPTGWSKNTLLSVVAAMIVLMAGVGFFFRKRS